MTSRAGTWTREIPPNHGLEFPECAGLDIRLPFEVGAQFTYHRVDLLEGKRAPTDDATGSVEYVSSQVILEAIINAGMRSRWPEQPARRGASVSVLRG